MRQDHGFHLIILASACLAGLCGPAGAQVSTNPAAVRAGGLPAAMIPGPSATAAGPRSGLATRGQTTVPSGLTPAPMGLPPLGVLSPPAGASLGGVNRRYQYWSPSTALWNVQERLNLIAPMTMYGAEAPPDRTATRSGSPSTTAGTPVSSTPALDPLGMGFRHPTPLSAPVPPFRDAATAEGSPAAGLAPGAAGATDGADGAREKAPAAFPSAMPPAAKAAGTGVSFAPRANQLDIPFEEFETFEDFDAWLRKQLAAPRDALAGRNMGGDNPLTRPGTDDGRNRATRQSPQAQQRPPIGYVGVASSAATQLGNIQLGPDVATGSARLVSELNSFLRQSPPQRRQPRERAGRLQTMPPPPTSNLGRRFPLQGGSAAPGPYQPYQTVPAVSGFAPQVQPQQYWQNLGGYELPPPRLDDWP